MDDDPLRTNVRRHTRDDIYSLISTRDELTRTDLIALTGMSRSAVNSAIGRLRAEGKIAESEPREKGAGSGSGRPAARLVAIPCGAPVGGIDFGHDHIQVAIADALGRPLGELSAEVDVDLRAEESMRIAADMLLDLRQQHSVDVLDGVVAGIPGPLDRSTGVVKSSTILSGWVDLAPARELGKLLGVPVQVENDAFLGAYGEMVRGTGRAHDNFLYVKASGGIGASLVVNRSPYRGSNGLAGEIGHTLLPGRTESCRCGNRGCLEAVVSVRQIRERVLSTHPGMLSDSVDLRTGADEVTGRILNEAGRTLGGVLAAFCDLLNPSALIIGGELGQSDGRFIEGVAASVNRYSQPATAAALRVERAQLGVRAELVGALEMAAAAVFR